MSKLKADLKGEREKSKRMWQMNCEQVKMHDELMMEKESEIERLREQLRLLRRHSPREDSPRSHHQSSREHSPLSGEHDSPSTEREPVTSTRIVRQGKAPPINPFTGENLEVTLNDWLMSLQRASTWNGWTEEELLIQLAGHLRGQALQEWNLLAKSEKSNYKDATQAFNSRLEHGSKALAAQDFRHLSQKEHESVSDFISRLEKTFQLAYGHDSMTIETRHTLLHSQLQEGLRQEIMSGPAVSGAEAYQALCLAAKNEERRLLELRKRRLYHRSTMPPQLSARKDGDTILKRSEQRSKSASNLKCYYCQKAGHYARDCRSKKEDESKGLVRKKWNAKQVQSSSLKLLMDRNITDSSISRKLIENTIIDPLSVLYSSDSDVSVVRVNDRGSKPQFEEERF